MSARENILGRIRASLRRETNDGAAALVRAHISARAMSPRPHVAGDLPALFREKALVLSTTISDVPDRQSVPAAAAAYLSSHALPMHAVCWNALGDLNWAKNGVSMEVRPARESDKVGITEAFCAIAETGTLITEYAEGTPTYPAN